VEKGSEQGGIEQVHEAQVYRLRGRLLPLVDLNQELRMAKPGEGNEAIATNIVVLQVDNRQFGLVVDEVHDTEEIVVRPLSKHLKGIRAYAGATIMGDGKLALILDVPGLAHSARLAAENKERAVQQDAVEGAASAEGTQKFVLFKGGGDARMALPLDTLARLEQLPASQIERSGTRWVAQYRGQILPLVRVGEALDGGGFSSEDFSAVPEIQVLVLNGEKHPFGLVVEQIVDIVESSAVMRTGSTRSGVLYSAVIAGHVTELLDAAALASTSAIHLPAEATE
jgi:two-component system chemotaxis sensor kinase CheA